MKPLFQLGLILITVFLFGACQSSAGQNPQPAAASHSTATVEITATSVAQVTPTTDFTYRKPPIFGPLEGKVNTNNVSLQVVSYHYDVTSRILFVRIKLENHRSEEDLGVSPAGFSIAGQTSPGMTATYYEDAKALTPQQLKSNKSVEGDLAFGPIGEFDSYSLLYYAPADGVINIPLN